jgi:hypothetical protein
MTSKPSQPQEEQVVEQDVDVRDDTLTPENLDQAIGGGAYPLPRGYGCPGPLG